MNQSYNLLCAMSILLFFTSIPLQAQQSVLIAPEVIASTGQHFTKAGLELSFTLGETMIDTRSLANYTLTQGFHQSEDVFLNVHQETQLQLVITPNDDGLNDAFVLEDLQNYPDHEILIINRWQSPVFRAKPYYNDWQGTSSGGQALPEGTYYYIVRLDSNGEEIFYGSITIKR